MSSASSPAPMTTAVAHGSREALDRMSLDVQGQMLRIRRNRSAWSGGGSADPGIVTIDLTTRSLRSARLIGPVRLDADNVRGLQVEFSVEGSGTLHAVRVNADALSLALLGSGRLEVAGTTRTLAGNFQGSGDVAAPGLVARNATFVLDDERHGHGHGQRPGDGDQQWRRQCPHLRPRGLHDQRQRRRSGPLRRHCASRIAFSFAESPRRSVSASLKQP